jgi:16S rRNA A1518/A1519 N6-dimethyltransferase RsmA/KsgA/DIM1 with predicted DNA glycosylase/AP lyase activity
MLISNNDYQVGTVVTFKLVTGEELLARVSGETMVEYQVVKPVTLVPTKQGTLAMVPYLISTDLNTLAISLNKSAVVMHIATKKEVAEQYTQAVSGIKTVSSLDGVFDAGGSAKR